MTIFKEKSHLKNQIAKLEEIVFEHSEENLFEILINNKELFNQFKKISTSDMLKNKFDYINNSEKLLKILLDKLDIEYITTQIKKNEKYKVKPIVKKHFPHQTPRKYQLETISKIYDAIENGYKYIILEAASGFGKTSVATTLSDIYSNEKSYILTTTKQLRSQYREEFEKFPFDIIEPRSQFTCIRNDKHTCSPSNCRGRKCKFNMNETCEYIFNLKKSLKSPATISSYQYFILENYSQSDYLNQKNYLTKRKLLILDEGHNIDELIFQNVNVELYEGKLREVGLDLNTEANDLDFSEEYYTFLRKAQILFKEKMDEYKVGSNKYNKYAHEYIKISKFIEYFKNEPQNIAYKRFANKIKFSPIKVNKIINEVILEKTDVCIFMSSSIFNSTDFTNDLGIKEEETYVLKVPHIFNLSNNPIKIYNDFNMNYETLKETAPKTIPTIKKILNEHKNEKGVIHTVSDDCKNFIIDNIQNSRLITHNTENREEILNEFKNSSKPLVLVSPSMNEGVDLPGDLCKFQIIYKLPYLPPNEIINKRKEIYVNGTDWYEYKMLTKLIQTYGRGIRFEGDSCKTYIIDYRLWNFIAKDFEGKGIIPQFFIDAIEDI